MFTVTRRRIVKEEYLGLIITTQDMKQTKNSMDINVGSKCEPFCEGSYGSETLRERIGMGRRKMGTDGMEFN